MWHAALLGLTMHAVACTLCFRDSCPAERPKSDVPVQALFFNHLYDPKSLVRDNEVKAAMAGMGVACQSFNSDLLFEPWEVLSVEGEPLTCFQEYWDKCVLTFLPLVLWM